MIEIDTRGRGLAQESELRAFEVAHNIRFHRDHFRFLTNQFNGGYPLTELAVPTVGCPGGAGLLHGTYGVNQLDRDFDMRLACEDLVRYLPRFVPFGYDQGGGQLLVDTVDRAGGLVFVPWVKLYAAPIVTYDVADSIDAFLITAEKLAIKWATAGP